MATVCKVCGKEGQIVNIRNHIEKEHCSFCGSWSSHFQKLKVDKEEQLYFLSSSEIQSPLIRLTNNTINLTCVGRNLKTIQRKPNEKERR